MRAHYLARRRNERRITEVGAHSGNFFEHVEQLVGRALLLKLTYKVAEHSAGHLIYERVYVHFENLRAQETVFRKAFRNLFEIYGKFVKSGKVYARIVFRAL